MTREVSKFPAIDPSLIGWLCYPETSLVSRTFHKPVLPGQGFELYFRRAAGTAPRLLVLWSFAVEQNALAFDAPSIAGERTVAANDTMAGDGDGKTVRSASSC